MELLSLLGSHAHAMKAIYCAQLCYSVSPWLRALPVEYVYKRINACIVDVSVHPGYLYIF